MVVAFPEYMSFRRGAEESGSDTNTPGTVVLGEEEAPSSEAAAGRWHQPSCTTQYHFARGMPRRPHFMSLSKPLQCGWESLAITQRPRSVSLRISWCDFCHVMSSGDCREALSLKLNCGDALCWEKKSVLIPTYVSISPLFLKNRNRSSVAEDQ